MRKIGKQQVQRNHHKPSVEYVISEMPTSYPSGEVK